MRRMSIARLRLRRPTTLLLLLMLMPLPLVVVVVVVVVLLLLPMPARRADGCPSSQARSRPAISRGRPTAGGRLRAPRVARRRRERSL